MKLKALLILLIVNFKVFSQSEFKYGIDGLEPNHLINQIDSLNKGRLYNKSIKWIESNYSNPNEAMVITDENEKIVFEGTKKRGVCTNGILGNCFKVKYRIELAFKDGRYKFQVDKLEGYDNLRKGISPYWFNIPLDSTASKYYKGRDRIRKAYSNYPEQIESVFNEVNQSLFSFLNSNQNANKTEDEW